MNYVRWLKSCWVLAVLCAQPLSASADWPEYRGNAQRTAFVPQPLPGEVWRLHWHGQVALPANAAWPAAARQSFWQRLSHIEHRVTDDRCDVPLLAKDGRGRMCLLVAHSAENRVACYDLQSGLLNWQYFCEAPVRFAPATHKGVAYFGSDDGHIHAVEITNGDAIWRRQIGPASPWIIGNDRFVSAHPLRSSVLIRGDQLFAAAGLFPNQGAYLVCCEITDGALRWRRRVEHSPQGYLLSDGSNRLIVPNGRAEPIAIGMQAGDGLQTLPSPGGSFCMLSEGGFFAGPGNAKNVAMFPAYRKSAMVPFQGSVVAAGNGCIWMGDGETISCFPSSRSPGTETLWTRATAKALDLLVSGEPDALRAFVATDDCIEILDAMSGEESASLPLPFSAKEIRLAVSSAEGASWLVATTESGSLAVWTTSDLGTPAAERADRKLGKKNAFMADEIANRVARALALCRSDAGFALVDASPRKRTPPQLHESIVDYILQHSRMQVVVTVGEGQFDEVCKLFRNAGVLGDRVSVVRGDLQDKKFGAPLFNLVLSDGKGIKQMEAATAPGGIMLDVSSAKVPVRKKFSDLAGAWRHQYASPTNTSDSLDGDVGGAVDFRLRWFGGVGPNRITDRHLRAPAPLACRDVFIIHGDGTLIGVDPANGVERWQMPLPAGAMRYGMPYDGGHKALSADGSQLFLAAMEEILEIDAYRGVCESRIELPAELQPEYVWGYLALADQSLLASAMPRDAPRRELDAVSARREYSDFDYRSERPLVCSQYLFSLKKNGAINWSLQSEGVIPNSSICVESQDDRIVFVEGSGPEAQENTSGRVPLPEIMKQAKLKCVRLSSGEPLWEMSLHWPDARNVIYTQIHDGKVVVVTSGEADGKAVYHLMVRQLANGNLLWSNSHSHVKAGLYHGEQVHHPVVLTRSDESVTLIAEPYFYDLESGQRQSPYGQIESWAIERPGHSCGTITAAGECLFFRAGNPTVLNLGRPLEEAFESLSPSRPSCWINMIPACGLLLIPEGSASCVCKYPLQTSMAFAPVPSM